MFGSLSNLSMEPEKAPIPAQENMARSYPRKHNTADLLKWPILEMLEPTFLKTIFMAFVYGNQALLVTKDNKVYAVGKNSLGCSGVGVNRVFSYFHPREVKELSQKGIKTFCYCKDSTVVALGKDGKMYYSEGAAFSEITMSNTAPEKDSRSSSHGFEAQLNSFYSTALSSPFGTSATANNTRGFTFGMTETKQFQTPMVVSSIACQQSQIFTLLENGEVFIWRRILPSVTLTPLKIFSYIHNSKFVCIETTHDTCVALTTNGKVFTWNTNKLDEQKQCNATEMKMPDGVKIEKIACGYNHTLALSDAGNVYAWGSIANGQLGYSVRPAGETDKQRSDEAQQVSVSSMGRVLEIAATNRCDISVAATSCGKVFMWGNCGGVIVPTPTLVPYTSMHEVFAKFASVRLMPRPLVIDIHYGSSVNDSLASAFDDQNTSDFTIMVEGIPIHVHKAVLKITSEYFRRMFQTDWIENDKNVIEHEEFSYVVYKAYLKYLYTDIIDLSMQDTLELLQLANLYLEGRLQGLCENAIINGMSSTNALHVFVAARRHSIQDLEEVSKGFILSHMCDVVKSEDFSNLDGELAKELLKEAVNKGVVTNRL